MPNTAPVGIHTGSTQGRDGLVSWSDPEIVSARLLGPSQFTRW
jgi:hypothetical protein